MAQTATHPALAETGGPRGGASLVAAGGFLAILAVGLAYAGFSLIRDLAASPPNSLLPYLLLFIALVIALSGALFWILHHLFAGG